MSNPRKRALAVGAVLFAAVGLVGCTNGNPPPATIPASGITSSNGGGMRATGALPDATVSGGQSSVGTMPSNPRVPRY